MFFLFVSPDPIITSGARIRQFAPSVARPREGARACVVPEFSDSTAHLRYFT